MSYRSKRTKYAFKKILDNWLVCHHQIRIVHGYTHTHTYAREHKQREFSYKFWINPREEYNRWNLRHNIYTHYYYYYYVHTCIFFSKLIT